MTLAALKLKLENFTAVIADSFLPSRYELHEMYVALHLYGLGGFTAQGYWSSSEFDGGDPTTALAKSFLNGNEMAAGKSTLMRVRACRAFTSATEYNLRDIGPMGGLIFWKSGNSYLESSTTDQSTSQAWSNITTGIGVTAQGSAIGTGQANTIAIVAQSGHTASAAKVCQSYSVSFAPHWEVYFDWKKYLNKPDKNYPCFLWSLDGASFTRDVRSSTVQETKVITCTVFAIASFDFNTQEKITVWDTLDTQFELYINAMDGDSNLKIVNIDSLKGEYVPEGMISADKEIGIMYQNVQLKLFC